MTNPRVVEQDMFSHILNATERLMAQEGLQNLSMHKIAKEAGIASGTLYLYFKNKNDLLNRLAQDLFERFDRSIREKVNENTSIAEQYRQMWLSKWAFLMENPTIATNLNQYRALLGFEEILDNCLKDPELLWNKFVAKGQAEKLIAKLPSEVLYALSMNVVLELAYLQIVKKIEFPQEVVAETIIRTWKAITV